MTTNIRKWLCKREVKKEKERVFPFSFSGIWMNNVMRTSCRSGADSIEYTSGSDALVFFGFRLDLFQALFVVDVLALFVFLCGRLVPHRLFPSSSLL